MSYNKSRMKRVWKKAVPVIVLALAVAACAFAFTACGAPGVSKASDLYGDYFAENETRSLTLSDDHVAVLGIGMGTSMTYYAKYDIGGGKIELREFEEDNFKSGKRGNVVYTLKIVDVDTLVIEFDEIITNEKGENVKSGETITLTFTRA